MMSDARWSTRRTISLTLVMIGTLLCVESTGAYTIFTRDGHRIDAEAPPEIKGIQAFLRLTPHGTLAVIQEEQIDWARTEAANPAPRRFAIPADAKLVQEKKQTPTPAPIDVKIVGGAKAAKEAVPEPQLSPEAKKVRDQEGLINLQREFAKLQGLKTQLADEKNVLGKELEDLRSRQTDYAGEDNAQTRRIRELEDRLRELDETIQKYDGRMNDIRGEAVALGGSID